MTLWMYYETDNDSGYYHIRLFSTQGLAETYRKMKSDAYGRIGEIEVDRKEEMPFKYDEVLCPDCGGEMVSRKGQYGVFWGCKKYPDCRGTRDNQRRSKADREKWKAEQAEINNTDEQTSKERSKKEWNVK